MWNGTFLDAPEVTTIIQSTAVGPKAEDKEKLDIHITIVWIDKDIGVLFVPSGHYRK